MAEPAQNFDETGEYVGDETYNEPANTNAAPVSRVSGVRKEYRKKNNKTATAGQVGGAAGEVAGATVQGTSKVVSTTGKGVTRAGAALSSTGVGAVVGVPLMAVGGTTTAVGKGGEAVGKGIKKTSRSVRRTSTQAKRRSRFQRQARLGRLNPQQQALERVRQTRVANIDTPPSNRDLKRRLKLPSIILRIVGYIFGFVTAIFNFFFVFFGFAYYIVDRGESLVSVFGIDIDLGANDLLGWTAMMLFLGFVTACIFVFVAYRVMAGKGAQPRNSARKEGLFLTALVMCFVPFANMYPWINHWVKHVAKHPE